MAAPVMEPESSVPSRPEMVTFEDGIFKGITIEADFLTEDAWAARHYTLLSCGRLIGYHPSDATDALWVLDTP